MTNILEIKEVVKAYGSKIAVDRVSLTVPQGTIFGLLGPNGAGKTSLIRMITTITRPDAGEIILNGERLHADHPRQIGYLPEERGLYKKMKVGEHLLYLGQLKGLTAPAARQAAQHWLEKLGMSERWNQPVEALSKGLQQQVQFIATVIHAPKLLILDEPFSGLDPVNTNRLKKEIRSLNEQGTSIIFSTHRMEQVEEICEDIMLINTGKNVLQGAVSEIRERYKQYHFQLRYQGALPPDFTDHFPIIERGKQSLTFAGKENETVNTILRQLLQLGVQIRSFTEVLPSLNDIFIRTVGAAAPAS